MYFFFIEVLYILFFFWKRFLFDKQQCTGHQNVDSVLMIFFAKNQNWVMKATRRPRVNESDELEEDTRFFFFFFKGLLFDKQQCTSHQKVDSVLLIFFATNQNWVMKATRRPRVNELDELDEDTRFFYFLFLRDFSLTSNNAQVTKRLIQCF